MGKENGGREGGKEVKMIGREGKRIVEKGRGEKVRGGKKQDRARGKEEKEKKEKGEGKE